MHEASVAQALLDQALKALPNPCARITKISVVAGALSGIEPDSLNFYFEQLRLSTPAENAVIEIKRIPATIACKSCDFKQDYNPGDELKTTCPVCSGPTKFTGTDELYLDSIEIEED